VAVSADQNGTADRTATDAGRLAVRLLELVPAVEQPAVAGSSWTERPKNSFDMTDPYGDP